MPSTDERHFKSSTHREKLVEHLFVGELLRHLWVSGAANVEILKPEVDRTGYDIVVVNGSLVRHVQLKVSVKGGSAAKQNVNASLASHPSGCVVWIVVNEDLRFEGFLWFGGPPGTQLPDLSKFRQAKNTRANAEGIKSERVNTKSIPKSAFQRVSDMPSLVARLFGERAL